MVVSIRLPENHILCGLLLFTPSDFCQDRIGFWAVGRWQSGWEIVGFGVCVCWPFPSIHARTLFWRKVCVGNLREKSDYPWLCRVMSWIIARMFAHHLQGLVLLFCPVAINNQVMFMFLLHWRSVLVCRSPIHHDEGRALCTMVFSHMKRVPASVKVARVMNRRAEL